MFTVSLVPRKFILSRMSFKFLEVVQRMMEAFCLVLEIVVSLHFADVLDGLFLKVELEKFWAFYR